MTLHFSYFDSDGFTFQDHLRFRGLENFLSSSLDTYPKLIRAFYSTFKLTDNGFKAEVKGKRISMSFEEFSNLSGLPFHGKYIDGSSEAEAADEGWEASFDRHTAVKDLMVDSFVETISLPIGQMKVHHRMLMYTLTRMLVPRSGNHVVVQKLDILLLWGLSKELKMSWTWIVLKHMMEASQSKLVLPYPQLITKILRHFKVSLVDEESSKTTLVFGESIVNQMQLKRVNGIWIRPLPNAEPVQPNTQQAAEPVAAPLESLAKLLEFMEAQTTHNAKMQASNARMEAALKTLQASLNSIVQNVDAIQVHLGIKLSFEDIADIGRQATEEQNPITLDSYEPHVKETPAEGNTAVSTSPLANSEEQPSLGD
ncbi:uncharacterized protein [Cicer arietinum]|uniref:uncharacterized protein n=1 Tax=Cicer arietinum TaxID=3827 RepID=UPI003CC6ADEF